MGKNVTHGLWQATAIPKPDLLTFSGDHQTDVAIIGAGYTGLSAALHLAGSGRECVVFDGQDNGFGCSGRNVGLSNAGLWLMPDQLIKLAGPVYGEKLLNVLGNSPDLVYQIIEDHRIECEPVRTGTLHCADSKAGLKALQQREAQWLKRGAPVRLLDRDETARKTGSSCFYGALLDKRAGTIQPLSYVYGLGHAAIKAGARIYKSSPVLRHETEKNGIKLITPHGSLRAKMVIVAVHAYPEHGFSTIKKSMIWMHFFQFSTPPLSEDILETVLPEKQGAWDTNLILSSYRLDQQGRLIVGSVGTVKDFAYGLHEAWVKRTIRKTFPQVGDVPLEHGWYGTFAMNSNHIPRLHLLDDNMVMVTSFNGRGIGPGTVFGKLLAEYITTGSLEHIPLPVSGVKSIWTRMFWEWFYETGARLYHFIQRRI